MGIFLIDILYAIFFQQLFFSSKDPENAAKKEVIIKSLRIAQNVVDRENQVVKTVQGIKESGFKWCLSFIYSHTKLIFLETAAEIGNAQVEKKEADRETREEVALMKGLDDETKVLRHHRL
jgi:hypothetical protein